MTGMKKLLTTAALLSMCSLGQAQTLERAADSTAPVVRNPRDTITAEYVTSINASHRQLGMWHISVAPLGYATALQPAAFRIPAWGVDCSTGLGFYANLRHSRTPNIDLIFDLHGWRGSSGKDILAAKVTVTALGIGLRFTDYQLSGTVLPYLQAGCYDITERVSVTGVGQTVSDDASALGFGIDVGVEVRLSRLISVPVEAMYLYGKPGDDVSAFGVATGISFNWGTVE
jgi:opacity protein-like surface antigen